jgi:hypothetical protein
MESNSRYSIVERLVTAKLKILDEKTNLTTGIDDIDMDIAEVAAEANAWEEEYKSQAEERRASYDKKINSLENKKAQLIKFKDEKVKNCDAKITEIDNALKAIKDISDSAGTSSQ